MQYEHLPNQKTLFHDQPLQSAFEQQSAQTWLPLEITQISAGDYKGKLRVIKQNNVSIFFERQNCTIHKRGIIEDQSCTISFSRTADTRLRFSEYNPGNDSLFFLPGGTEFDAQVGSDTETVYLRFEQSRLLERVRALNPILWEKDPDNLLMFDTLDRKPLETFINHLCANPKFQEDSVVEHDCNVLGSSIMDQVVMTLNSSSLSEEACPDLIARRRARSLVTQVIEHIDATMANQCCPSIVDICADLNVSQRNLQYSFKKILGLAPNTYIHRLRLNRVNAQLSNPASDDITVTHIASRWHFWHLGRFANDYLQLFHELPSTTLRRALA